MPTMEELNVMALSMFGRAYDDFKFRGCSTTHKVWLLTSEQRAATMMAALSIKRNELLREISAKLGDKI